MRTIASVNSSTSVLSEIQVEIIPANTNSSYFFNQKDIIDISGLSWEVSFGGGFGKPSNYDVTLSSSLGFIKSIIKDLPRSEVRLKVTLNDDFFYPHFGKVQSIQRDGSDPNKFSLKVYDRFLDKDPFFPLYPITNSYSNVHPKVSGADFGKPVYYGKHLRPIFHTPVDCSIKTLLSPSNVSALNSVSSVYFNDRLTDGLGIKSSVNSGSYSIDNSFVHLMETTWNSSSETVVSSADFQVTDFQFNSSTYISDDKVLSEKSIYDQTSEGDVDYIRGNLIDGTYGIRQIDTNSYNALAKISISKKINADIINVNRINYSIAAIGFQTVTDQSFRIGYYSADSLSTPTIISIDASLSNTLVGSQDMGGISSLLTSIFSASNAYHYFIANGNIDVNSPALFNAYVSYDVSLSSKDYSNYSIYSPMVNCGDVAVSENPFTILSDIYDQSSIDYISTQKDQSVTDSSSYFFNCIFAERRKITDISNEFCKITGQYLWVADSGMVNFRTYQESAFATVNATITTSDILSFQLKENPLGVSIYETEKAKNVKVDYGFNFLTQEYENLVQANPNNSIFCQSAEAGGIDNEVVKSSKYILDDGTANLYLNNLVRKLTQPEEFAEINLPARYFNLELTDVVKIQHPMLIGSESIYQIINIKPDYINGKVFVRCAKLLAL